MIKSPSFTVNLAFARAAASCRSWARVALGTLLCLAAPYALAQPEPPPRPVTQFVQSWLGGVEADRAWLLREPETQEQLSGDFSTLPLAGGAGQRLWGEGLAAGFEGGGLVSWRSDRVTLFGTNERAELQIENNFFMIETFFGGLVSASPAPWLRTYLAAGPSIAWGYLDDEDDNDERARVVQSSSSGVFLSLNGGESDFSVSLYARAGMAFEFRNGFSVGVSARYFDHSFDFGDRGELTIDSVQWFLTFGQRLSG
jgi:hypothetical protein